MADAPQPADRVQRRKQRTRAALIRAAQGFIAEGKFNVPVLDITQAADVGMGTFYNHFDSKEELFRAALEQVFDRLGELLDCLPDVDDPAETFARSFRLMGRTFRRSPEQSRVALNVGLRPILSPRGLAPRALRDIKAANAAGRFHVADPELAVTLAAGAWLGLGQLLLSEHRRDDAEATDQMTEDLLRLYGVPADQAHDICRRPLPSLEDLTRPDSAA